MADSVVTIGADLSALRRDLAKMPNMSGEAAQKTLVQLEKAVKRAESASKRAIKSTRRAQVRAAKEAEKAAKDARDGFKGVIELAGVSGDKVDKLGAVFGALSSPLGLATVALTATAAAAIGATAAVVGMGIASVKLVRASRELADELYAYREIESFEGMQPEALARIDRANASLDAVGVIAKQLVISLGAELSPAVERAARFMGTLGLAGLDAFNALAEGTDLVLSVARGVGSGLVKYLAGPIDKLFLMVNALSLVAEAVGADGVAGKMREATRAWDDFTLGIAGGAIDIAAEGFERLEFSLGDYGDQLDEIIGKAGELAAAEGNRGKAQQEALKAQKDLADATDDNYERMLTAIDKVRDAQAQAAQESQKQLDEEAARAVQRADTIAGAYTDVVGSFADGAKLIAKQLASENKQAALDAFKVYQAAAISQALIAGAVSVSTIWRDWAGYPPVAAALTAGTMANTTLQVATIASETPSFHRGGMVQREGNRDEVPATLLTGEAVLNRETVRALSRSGVSAGSGARAAGGGGGYVVQEYRNRIEAGKALDLRRRAGSPVRDHRRGGRRYGR